MSTSRKHKFTKLKEESTENSSKAKRLLSSLSESDREYVTNRFSFWKKMRNNSTPEMLMNNTPNSSIYLDTPKRLDKTKKAEQELKSQEKQSIKRTY